MGVAWMESQALALLSEQGPKTHLHLYDASGPPLPFSVTCAMPSRHHTTIHRHAGSCACCTLSLEICVLCIATSYAHLPNQSPDLVQLALTQQGDRLLKQQAVPTRELAFIILLDAACCCRSLSLLWGQLAQGGDMLEDTHQLPCNTCCKHLMPFHKQ